MHREETKKKRVTSPNTSKEMHTMKVVVKSKNDKKEANTIIYHEQPQRRHRTIRSRHSSPSDSPRNQFSSLSSDEDYSKENIKSRGEPRARSKSVTKKKS
jgi:hypothetical protein